MEFQAFVQEYKRLRGVSIEVSGDLVKSLTGDDMQTAARQLGMLDGKTINLATEDESAVLMDHAIQDIYHDGMNAVGRFLLTKPYAEGSAELCLLRSMQTAHFSLMQVEKPIPGVGVIAIDRLRNTRILLIDINFSHNAERGLIFATRIHSPGEGWWMTTGASLPVSREAMDEIVDHLGDCNPTGEDPARNAMILRTCVSAGASNQIAYADPPDAGAGGPLAAAPKVGRNEPCPCGSGKKYKKCCGG